jgi:hypothetical protein
VNAKQNIQPQLPSQFRAVLKIVSADGELRRKALPHVDLGRREVNWTEIFKSDLGSGHRAALIWAKALYRDEAPPKADAFDRAFAMDQILRSVVLEAIAIRWGLA